MSFIMLNNDTVWNFREENDTYIKKYGNKIIYIMCYLDCKVDRVGNCNFSLEDMITCCGLKVDTHKGKSVDQFRNTLLLMEKEGIISNSKVDLHKVKPKELIVCEFNKNIKSDDNGFYEFYQIDTNKFIKLMDEPSTNKKFNLLNTYSYILARIHKGDDSTNWCEGGARVCYFSNETLMKDLVVKSQLLTSCLQELSDKGFIVYNNIGYVKKDNNIKLSTNVYALEEEQLKSGLKYLKENVYEKNGYTIIKNKDIKEMKTLRGKLGACKKLKNKGYDVTKLEKQINKLKEKIKDK